MRESLQTLVDELEQATDPVEIVTLQYLLGIINVYEYEIELDAAIKKQEEGV